jgi:predicted PurR-regulated permease PerM
MTQTERQFYPRVFALVAVGLLGYVSFKVLEPFLEPLMWAGLLAFLLFPVNGRLRRVVRGQKGKAALLLTVAVILVIVIPVSLLIGVFITQASDLVERLRAGGGFHIVQFSDLMKIPILERIVQSITHLVPVTEQQIEGWSVEGGKRLLQTLISYSGSIFTGALGAFINVLLALFLFFFFLRDGDEVVGRAMLLIPMEEEYKTHLTDHLSAVTRAVVLGALITALLQGTLIGAGFAIVGLPSPVVFAVLASVAALLPFVGTALVWAPAALVLAAQGRYGAAVFMVLWGLLVASASDNFVRPLFISGRAQISTLTVFIGLLGGLSAFGAIGMFVGPVFVALILALLQFAEEWRGKRLTS